MSEQDRKFESDKLQELGKTAVNDPRITRGRSAMESVFAALAREIETRQRAENEAMELRDTFGIGSLRTLGEAAEEYRTMVAFRTEQENQIRSLSAALDRLKRENDQLQTDWQEFLHDNIPRAELEANWVSLGFHQGARDEIEIMLSTFERIANESGIEPRREARAMITGAARRGFKLPEGAKV